MGGGVLYDGWCGEPIAWARVGERVIGQEWTRDGYVAITERLTPAEAVRKYGPITEVELGRNGGFRSITYGTTKFIDRFVDPRGTGLYDDTVVVIDDPARQYHHECPVCKVPTPVYLSTRTFRRDQPIRRPHRDRCATLRP